MTYDDAGGYGNTPISAENVRIIELGRLASQYNIFVLYYARFAHVKTGIYNAKSVKHTAECTVCDVVMHNKITIRRYYKWLIRKSELS